MYQCNADTGVSWGSEGGKDLSVLGGGNGGCDV
jgi:hypothetical protein